MKNSKGKRQYKRNYLEELSLNKDKKYKVIFVSIIIAVILTFGFLIAIHHEQNKNNLQLKLLMQQITQKMALKENTGKG